MLPRLRISKEVKSHALTITIIGGLVGFMYGGMQLGKSLKRVFAEDAYSYHQEVEDFIYAQEISARRRAGEA